MSPGNTDDLKLAVGEILGSTKHMMKQLEAFRDDLKSLRSELREEQDQIKARLAVVEQFMWKSLGGALAASIVLPVIISVLSHFITGV